MRTCTRLLLAAVTAAAAATATPAVAAPDAASLAARQRALDAAQERVDGRLDAARASLASTRARAEALRARYTAQADIVSARLRAAYADPQPAPLTALVSGRLDLATTQADLLAAAQRADAASLASLRIALDEMKAAEADVARRKQALAGQRRLLEARRAAVTSRLERLAPDTVTPPVSSPADPAAVDARAVPGGGLPASVLRARSLPGAAPVDARTGDPVSLDPPRGPAASIDEGGGVGVAWPTRAYTGPRRLTPVTGVYAGRAGTATPAGAAYDPNAMMAVHRTLPLGTRLQLRHGDATVVVAIVDRGPFRTDRDLEISPAAAMRLGIRGPVTLIATVPR